MMLTRRTLLRLAAGAAAVPGLPFAETAPAAKKSRMIVRSVRPEDLEMPLEFFDQDITPIEHFFVRTHTYAPMVSLSEWRLDVNGLVRAPLKLTMADLRQLPRAEVVSVLECAGNGRALYRPTIPGLQWEYGAAGNGRWTGVRLADVLKKAGIREGALEVLFEGADSPPGTMPDFQRTIPLKKALDPNTLLAFEMNGQTLPVQHGFPLRLIVPGWAGDAWMKWVTRITLLDREFDGFFMKIAYRHPGKPVRPGEAVPPEQMFPVTSLQVKSVIAAPAHGAAVKSGQTVRITGAAWAGDTGPVEAVDVSVDGGRSWRPAQLRGPRTEFGWRTFSFPWTPDREQFYTIMARARTTRGDTQPFDQEWNPSGYGWNVVHRVGVSSGASATTAAAPAKPGEYPPGYRQACLVCHENDVTEQQRLTRGQWEREIDKMVRWGAKVRPEDRDRFLDYLVTHFGAR
jgi:sulfite oxidase